MSLRFRDREDAGAQLGQRLQPLAGRDDLLVLALPPWGSPVAARVAAMLKAPLEAFSIHQECTTHLEGRQVVLVDVGATTGKTMVSAVRAVRRLGPATIIAAAPVMTAVAACHIATVADRCVTVRVTPMHGSPEPCCNNALLVSDGEAPCPVGAVSVGEP
jgi:predicted phosphoribosyltransferase